MYMKVIISMYQISIPCSTHMGPSFSWLYVLHPSPLLNVPSRLLFQCPLDRLSDAIFQADQWRIPKSPFCLVNAVVSCHAGICVPLARECGRLSNQPADSFTQEANYDTHVLGDNPDVLLAVGAARGVPDEAAKVPKVYGAVVGDEEGLAVDALVVEGHGRGGVREQEGAGG